LQFEGAFLSDGKGLNNWDVFTHKTGFDYIIHIHQLGCPIDKVS